MNHFASFLLFILCLFFSLQGSTPIVEVGIERLFKDEYRSLLLRKRVALLTNHTGVNGRLESSIDIVKKKQKEDSFTLVALFSPEHGLYGEGYAYERVEHGKDKDGIPIFSLHGETRRPTDAMLSGIDLILFDIQDIGSRSYSYISTLFYVMEEAAKKGIEVVVLDRPNPINGIIVDGPMMQEDKRSFVGYINVPYCHGMTVAELASFFNEEYKIGCKLKIVPMRGWKRWMSFKDTRLPWVPTSPQIPDADTPLTYPTTGIMGELKLTSIGVGYTLPFKVVAAPWIDPYLFCKKLNEQNFPGVVFKPVHIKPFFGRFAKTPCKGALIVVTDPAHYLPVSTGYLILGMIKTLYPKEFRAGLNESKKKPEMFTKLCGTEEVLTILDQDFFVIWPLRNLHKKERDAFLKKRENYLLSAYR